MFETNPLKRKKNKTKLGLRNHLRDCFQFRRCDDWKMVLYIVIHEAVFSHNRVLFLVDRLLHSRLENVCKCWLYIPFCYRQELNFQKWTFWNLNVLSEDKKNGFRTCDLWIKSLQQFGFSWVHLQVQFMYFLHLPRGEPNQ